MNTDMHIDRENGRFLGVCAGVANWLDLPAVLVRIVFVICVLAWPPLLIAYFVIYFCADKDFTPDRIRNYFRASSPAEHFRRIDYRKPIYRSRSNRRVAGVCAGIAEYLEVSTFSVRLVTLLSFFLLGPFTFWAYIICWFVIESEPSNEEHEQGYRARRAARRRHKEEKRAARHQRRAERAERKQARNVRKGYVNSEETVASASEADLQSELEPDSGEYASTLSRQECTQVYSEMEQRLRDMEAFMTSKRFRLHCEINRI